MTREEARAYFKEKGLTYADISRTDLDYLRVLLDRNFVKERMRRIKSGDYRYWTRVNPSKNYGGEWSDTGALIHAHMTGKGENFTRRQVISFNRDGFIGFCGDTSDRNAAPVLEAFAEWCDELAAEKEVLKTCPN